MILLESMYYNLTDAIIVYDNGVKFLRKPAKEIFQNQHKNLH